LCFRGTVLPLPGFARRFRMCPYWRQTKSCPAAKELAQYASGILYRQHAIGLPSHVYPTIGDAEYSSRSGSVISALTICQLGLCEF
jgi:hypothetical protein